MPVPDTFAIADKSEGNESCCFVGPALLRLIDLATPGPDVGLNRLVEEHSVGVSAGCEV